MSVNTGATSKVAAVVLRAAPRKSPRTAIGSGPAKFWLRKRGWLVWTERSMTRSTAADSASRLAPRFGADRQRHDRVERGPQLRRRAVADHRVVNGGRLEHVGEHPLGETAEVGAHASSSLGPVSWTATQGASSGRSRMRRWSANWWDVPRPSGSQHSQSTNMRQPGSGRVLGEEAGADAVDDLLDHAERPGGHVVGDRVALGGEVTGAGDEPVLTVDLGVGAVEHDLGRGGVEGELEVEASGRGVVSAELGVVGAAALALAGLVVDDNEVAVVLLVDPVDRSPDAQRPARWEGDRDRRGGVLRHAEGQLGADRCGAVGDPQVAVPSPGRPGQDRRASPGGPAASRPPGRRGPLAARRSASSAASSRSRCWACSVQAAPSWGTVPAARASAIQCSSAWWTRLPIVSGEMRYSCSGSSTGRTPRTWVTK